MTKKHNIVVSCGNEHAPFDELSYASLLFLSERCDFSEPWNGFGFATEIEREIKAALTRKPGDD